jgi:hypothetical protein
MAREAPLRALRTVAKLSGLILPFVLVSACDPAPQAEFRNGAGQPIVMRSVKPIHGVYEPNHPKDVTIRPGKAIRFVGWGVLTLNIGQCDLKYSVPYKTLPTHVGLIIPFEMRPDGWVYLRAQPDEGSRYHPIGLDEQPAGWPLKPETDCG